MTTETIDFLRIALDVLGPFGMFLVAFIMTFNKGMGIVERILNVYSERTLVQREIGQSLGKLADSFDKLSNKNNEDKEFDRLKDIVIQAIEQAKEKDTKKKVA